MSGGYRLSHLALASALAAIVGAEAPRARRAQEKPERKPKDASKTASVAVPAEVVALAGAIGIDPPKRVRKAHPKAKRRPAGGSRERERRQRQIARGIIKADE